MGITGTDAPRGISDFNKNMSVTAKGIRRMRREYHKELGVKMNGMCDSLSGTNSGDDRGERELVYKVDPDMEDTGMGKGAGNERMVDGDV